MTRRSRSRSFAAVALWILVPVATALVAALVAGLDATAPEPVVPANAGAGERGERWFADGSFGSLSLATLQTSALPARPVDAMLALAEADRTGRAADERVPPPTERVTGARRG